jgi:hypothetical protein
MMNYERFTAKMVQIVQRLVTEQMFTMKREVVGRPSAVSDDFVQNVHQNMCERQRFIISKLSGKCPQISRTLLYDIITVGPGYHKFG